MAKPPYDQAKELARWYAGLALAVSMYRFNHWDTLTEDERRDLEQKHWSLETYSQDFLRAAADLVFADAEKDLAQIGEITQSITSDLGKLKTVQLVLDVVGATMTLAGAIVSKEPAAIAKQAQALSATWKTLRETEKKPSRGATAKEAAAGVVVLAPPPEEKKTVAHTGKPDKKSKTGSKKKKRKS